MRAFPRLAVFGIAFLMLVSVQVVSLFALRSLMDASARQAHTSQVLEELLRLRLRLVSVQEAQRTWLLLRDAPSRRAFDEYQMKVAESAAGMRRLTADNPLQHRRAAELEAAVLARIDYMGDLVEQRPPSEADLRERLAHGSDRTRDILDRVHEMESTERSLLASRTATAASFGRLSQITVMVGGGGSILVLVLAFLQMFRNERTQQDLLAQTAQQAELLALANDAIFAWDGDDRIIYWNRGAERTYGYTAEEVVGRSPSQILDTVFPVSRQAIQATLDRGGTWEGELVQRRRDGSRLITDSRWAQKVEGGHRVVLEINTDVTRRREAEKEAAEARRDLERTVDQLRASNQELEQFAYVASHDLQEPLRMVASYTQLIQKRYQGRLDDAADEFIGYAVDGANRMQQLIQDLLSYSRVSQAKRTATPVALDDALVLARANLAVALEESNGEIEAEPLPVVLGDRPQLVQLLQNLLGNGLKYRHAARPPRLRVFARDIGDGRCEIGVADNGIGIEPQYLERIFVIFQRLHGREQYPGTGIGLAICKKIVERHGGKIRVESTPGHGTTFYFTLTRETSTCPTESPSTSSSSKTTPATSA